MIEGDTGLGLAVKNLLDSLDPGHLRALVVERRGTGRAGSRRRARRGAQGPVQGAPGGWGRWKGAYSDANVAGRAPSDWVFPKPETH